MSPMETWLLLFGIIGYLIALFWYMRCRSTRQLLTQERERPPEPLRVEMTPKRDQGPIPALREDDRYGYLLTARYRKR